MNISLIGMPASGKTTIAKELCELFKDYILVDTDEKIVKIVNKPITDIFAQNGEEYFRELETQVLTDILKNDKQIISTGGGIIKREENLNLLKEKTIAIYLKSDINTLIERAKTNKERPLLNVPDLEMRLKKLLNERKIQYEKANIIINIENKTPKNIAIEIMEKINENSRSKNKGEE